jgi:hypothetical protein
MKVGDLVTVDSESGWCDRGVVVNVAGRKWVKIVWMDGVIQREHIDDLELISENK